MNFLKAFIFPLLINPFGQLIEDLDSPSYEVRRASILRLEQIGHIACEHLEFQSRYHKSLNVRITCDVLLGRIYRGVEWSENTISIWVLPKKYRFVDGIDVGEVFYKKAEHILIMLDDKDAQEGNYQIESVQKLAMSLFLKDFIKKNGRNKLPEVLKDIEYSENQRISFIPWWYYKEDAPPKLIEDIIAERNNTENKENGTISKEKKWKTRKSKHRQNQ